MKISCFLRSVKYTTKSFMNTLNPTIIKGHNYIEILPDLLKCEDCGYYSWNFGEGFKLPEHIKNKIKNKEV